MNLKAYILGAVMALAATAGPAFAWDLVGTRDVRDRTERDTIVVEGPRQFERIRLCVYRQPVHLIDLDVRFANGGHQDVSVRQRINPGECTRAIDLNGDDRNITSVSMVYEETSFRRRHATVRLFAE
ncbi:DUF2541 family protein [Vitreimonas flagellata]|uniref:DUF2541 family protein n=1 Tax=Vitreimonas flagellata TaxID=2560861 RepID=UPI001074D272|nr:DUF2541 family protein [Vitreimonas flagellata]